LLLLALRVWGGSAFNHGVELRCRFCCCYSQCHVVTDAVTNVEGQQNNDASANVCATACNRLPLPTLV